KHPLNIAYEAATADLDDVNMIDPFHLEAYGKIAVNYNRDVEIFPVLDALFTQIYGANPYKSPTDMGVNMIQSCITDDAVVSQAARDEIIRRYYNTCCQVRKGNADQEQVSKLELIMEQAHIQPSDRAVAVAAMKRAEDSGGPAAAIQLEDGTIITGKTSELLGATSAMLLSALKHLAGISKDVDLISPIIIEPICKLKTDHLGNTNPRLHSDEVLIALSICALTDLNARKAMEQLRNLSGSEVHTSVILSQVDVSTLRKLGVNLTCEPVYQTKKLYHAD
ncbi:MAG: DUF1846 family protein, partial [Bacteroidales bacterium]|nr:DUF1846 family protein [Bacteroidales bacterium]